MFLMMLFFVVGVDRTEVEQVCTLFSVLIHYFTLASVFWMGAEALLMGKKLIFDVFGRFSMLKFTLLVSFIAWGKLSKSFTSLFVFAPYHCTYSVWVLNEHYDS